VAELRLRQGLAQQVAALGPELMNGEATVGELAWGWAKDFDVLNQPVQAVAWHVVPVGPVAQRGGGRVVADRLRLRGRLTDGYSNEFW
jgi:hypothetical protein